MSRAFISRSKSARCAIYGYQGRFGGTTANEGTRGSLVRMTLDVVYYSWAGINTRLPNVALRIFKHAALLLYLLAAHDILTMI